MRVCPSVFGDGCHPSQQLALPHPLVELRAYYCRDTPRGLLGLCHIDASQCNQEGAPTSLLCRVSCEMGLVANKGEAGGLAWTRSWHNTGMRLTRLRESSSCSADAQEAGHRDMASVEASCSQRSASGGVACPEASSVRAADIVA